MIEVILLEKNVLPNSLITKSILIINDKKKRTTGSIVVMVVSQGI